MSHNLQDSAAGQTLARGGVASVTGIHEIKESGASLSEAGMEKEAVSVEGKIQ